MKYNDIQKETWSKEIFWNYLLKLESWKPVLSGVTGLKDLGVEGAGGGAFGLVLTSAGFSARTILPCPHVELLGVQKLPHRPGFAGIVVYLEDLIEIGKWKSERRKIKPETFGVSENRKTLIYNIKQETM